MEILAKNFLSREELEDYITTQTGRSSDKKLNFQITGTKEELKRLHLSHGKECWGISVTQTGVVAPTTEKVVTPVDRGKIYKPVPNKSINIKNSKEL